MDTKIAILLLAALLPAPALARGEWGSDCASCHQGKASSRRLTERGSEMRSCMKQGKPASDCLAPKPAAPSPAPAAAAPAAPSRAAKSRPPTLVLQRYFDTTEGAFLALVPKGWIAQGGVFRVLPDQVGGAGQSVEAKVDFTIKREPEGKVAVRWLPKYNFMDPRGLGPSAPMFPPGSNYNGMKVMSALGAEQFLLQVAMPFAHPGAQGVQVTKREDLRAVAQALYQAQPLGPFDVAQITVRYTEGGVAYREVLFCVIQVLQVGMWSNNLTIAARAPESEADGLAGVASMIVQSLQLNPGWVAAEAAGQRTRGQIVKATLDAVMAIDADISRNRSATNDAINHGMQNVLLGREDYKNPFTSRVEQGSNEWKNRWQNAWGDVIYTDDAGYDPNADPRNDRGEFRRSKAAKP